MINSIFLMAPAPGGESNPTSSLIMILLIGLVFYFFMIRPQVKKQKAQRKFLSELKKGSNVVTIGGLHGKIQKIAETTVDLEVGGGVVLTFEKSAISSPSQPGLAAKKD